MPTIYIIEPDARLEKEYGRILVTKDDEVLLRVPAKNVSGVVIVGQAGATTPALHALLKQGAPLFFVKRNGDLVGRLLPASGANLPLRQAQYRRNDEPEFALAFARQLVAAKIANQDVLCKRLLRRKRIETSAQSFEKLKRASVSALACGQMESLLGIEGSAANAYFALFRQAFGAEWDFKKRTRRPPRDPVNALLSLGYTFLGYALMTALETVGLDPYLGYFHQEAYGRPALALDLVEEFRAPVIDSLVLGLVNRHLLQLRDFEPGSRGGIYLTRAGMRIFLREFEDRLETEITVADIGRPLSYRKLFEVQARKVARLVSGEAETYQPFRWR